MALWRRYSVTVPTCTSIWGCFDPGSGLLRWVIARIDWLRQKPLLNVGPKLTDVLIGLYRRIDQLAVFLFATANEEVANNVAEMIEVEFAARPAGQRTGAARG